MRIQRILVVLVIFVSQFATQAQAQVDDLGGQITGAVVVFYGKDGSAQNDAAKVLENDYVITEITVSDGSDQDGSDKIAFKHCFQDRPQTSCEYIGRPSGYLISDIKANSYEFTRRSENFDMAFKVSGAGAAVMGAILLFKRSKSAFTDATKTIGSVLLGIAVPSAFLSTDFERKAEVLNSATLQADQLQFEPSGLASSEQAEIQVSTMTSLKFIERLQNLLMSIE